MVRARRDPVAAAYAAVVRVALRSASNVGMALRNACEGSTAPTTTASDNVIAADVVSSEVYAEHVEELRPTQVRTKVRVGAKDRIRVGGAYREIGPSLMARLQRPFHIERTAHVPVDVHLGEGEGEGE